MSAVIAPLTGAGTTDPGVGAVVLLVVLLAGVAAGRSKRRLTLLVAGVVAIAVAGFLLTGMTVRSADRAGQLTAMYAVSVPLAVAYLAGWLCGRGSWVKRLLVIGAAAVLLAVFPYAAAAQATAAALNR